MRRSRALLTSLCMAGVAFITAGALNTRDLVLFNASPSAPTGFYLRTNEPVRDGAFVTVRASDVAPGLAALRGFADERDRFIKRALLRPGVQVCARGSWAISDTRVLRRRVVDADGHALPTWDGCRTLGDNEVFLVGDTDDSFDSRYFGVVPLSAIEGVWRPILLSPTRSAPPAR